MEDVGLLGGQRVGDEVPVLVGVDRYNVSSQGVHDLGCGIGGESAVAVEHHGSAGCVLQYGQDLVVVVGDRVVVPLDGSEGPVVGQGDLAAENRIEVPDLFDAEVTSVLVHEEVSAHEVHLAELRDVHRAVPHLGRVCDDGPGDLSDVYDVHSGRDETCDQGVLHHLAALHEVGTHHHLRMFDGEGMAKHDSRFGGCVLGGG